MGCKCTSALCMRLKGRLAPILALFASVTLMSVFFMNWHLEDPDCALLRGPLHHLIRVEQLLGFADTTQHHVGFVVWIIMTIIFTVTCLSTVFAYPRCLNPLLFIPGLIALWPVYITATRTEMFLYVIPMHFSINAAFVMILDEPRTSDLFEDVEWREKDASHVEQGLLSPRPV